MLILSRIRSRLAAACEWLFGASPSYVRALLHIAQQEAMIAASVCHASSIRTTVLTERLKIDRALKELAKPTPDLEALGSILRGECAGGKVDIVICADFSVDRGRIGKIIDEINHELRGGANPT